jgi:hypothetical protein
MILITSNNKKDFCISFTSRLQDASKEIFSKLKAIATGYQASRH